MQQMKDVLLAPIRMLLPDVFVEKMGLTSLEMERINAVFPNIQGRLLDIGAGKNKLVKKYGNGVGVDVLEWGGGAIVVPDSSALPFADGEFDTITFLACLNHIPYREAVLREARRLLDKKGRLIITMINPLLGLISHKIRWFAEDTKRKWCPGERYGISSGEIIRICQNAGFELSKHKRFFFYLNNVYIFNAANQ